MSRGLTKKIAKSGNIVKSNLCMEKDYRVYQANRKKVPSEPYNNKYTDYV